MLFELVFLDYVVSFTIEFMENKAEVSYCAVKQVFFLTFPLLNRRFCLRKERILFWECWHCYFTFDFHNEEKSPVFQLPCIDSSAPVSQWREYTKVCQVSQAVQVSLTRGYLALFLSKQNCIRLFHRAQKLHLGVHIVLSSSVLLGFKL